MRRMIRKIIDTHSDFLAKAVGWHKQLGMELITDCPWVYEYISQLMVLNNPLTFDFKPSEIVQLKPFAIKLSKDKMIAYGRNLEVCSRNTGGDRPHVDNGDLAMEYQITRVGLNASRSCYMIRSLCDNCNRRIKRVANTIPGSGGKLDTSIENTHPWFLA